MQGDVKEEYSFVHGGVNSSNFQGETIQLPRLVYSLR
jgi:hypothetical protein